MSLPLEITLLGTGTSQGIPVIGCQCKVCTSTDPKNIRLRTSAYIKTEKICLLIDIGPDFRAQMLNNQIDDVHAVLITHEHNDHVSGLDDIRPINFLRHRDIPFYSLARTRAELEKRFYYAFDPAYQYPGRPRVHSISIDIRSDLELDGISITPILVDHGGLDILGFRIGDLAYITDAKSIPQESMEALLGLDVLIINALRIESHQSHLNLEEAINICSVLKPKRSYLTHISHDMGLQSEVNESLPENIRLGYDGLTIKLA